MSQRAVLLSMTLLLAVGACDRRHGPCALQVCDIREGDCQQSVAAAAACLRGVAPVSVPMTVMAGSAYVEGQSTATPSPEELVSFQRWNSAFALLRLAPAELTLQQARGRNAGQVAAFYAGKAAGITILDWGEPLDSLPAVALLVHEYTHALQDEAFGLGAFSQQYSTDHDSSLASGAIVEGEADHVQDLAAIDLFGTPREEIPWSTVFDSWTRYARRALHATEVPVLLSWAHFRYPFGTRLVNEAWRGGGWPAVDQLLAQPPTSARQVLAGWGAGEPEDGPWLEDLGESSIPVLPPELEMFQSDRMGAWIFETFLRRIDRSDLELLASARLRGDRLSMFVNHADEVVHVFWRLRFSTAQMADDVARAAERDGTFANVWRFDQRDVVIHGGSPLPRPEIWRAVSTTAPPPDAGSGVRRIVCPRRGR